MKDDNTPTVISRRRKPTPHQRLRLEKAKELKKLGALSKKKRDTSKKQNPGETDPEKMVKIAPRIPKLKKDALSKPAKPPAKFRKRQIHKSWLPTHLFHAKRAHMTPPKEPLWRFAIPLTPTEKCFRPTHRAVTLRGCVTWDMSYMATIGVEGVQSSLLGLLKSVGVDEKIIVGKRGAKWRRGSRWWEGWIRERDGEKRWIAKVGIVWCLDTLVTENSGTIDSSKDMLEGHNADQDMETEGQGEPKATHAQKSKQELKGLKQRLLLRVHPSAFLQTWTEILKIAKIQRPAAMVEDLRFEIGSIEVVGPESTEALIGVLQPAKPLITATESTTVESPDDEWVDVETPERIWPQLVGTTNPASLPAGAVIGFNISDPRLRHPPRTVKKTDSETSNDALLELIASWPPDHTHIAHDLFDRTKRLAASRQLLSQKAINRRKGEALPGAYPAPSPTDTEIPILLMASRTTTYTTQGSWTLLLPWDCVLPVWYSLMHYPLSSGGNPRFGGLQERQQIAFEQGVPWYPADYPGTKAGYHWELLERERKKQEWEKRPKGKRTAWESVELGNGKRGEIGLGWACDWERLLQGPPPSSVDGEEKTTPEQSAKDGKEKTSQKTKIAESSPEVRATRQQPVEPANPPLAIHNLISPLSGARPFPPTALSAVHITLLTTGHPTRNARIYRLPSKDADLRAKWLALTDPTKNDKQSRQSRPAVALPKNAPLHQRAQGLAASLLAPSSPHAYAGTRIPKAGDPSYPCVPDEADLIGFVTTGNYHLGEGKCEAIGNVAVAKAMGEENKKGKGNEKNMCIIREAGQSIGRLARWKFV